MYSVKCIGILLLYVFVSQCVVAQQAEGPLHTLSISHENDWMNLRQPSDRYYSAGLSVEWEEQAIGDIKLLGVDAWAIRYIFPFELLDRKYIHRFKLAVRHQIYTPSDIRDAGMRHGDQPYAGLLVLHLNNTVFDPYGKKRIRRWYELGVIGPASMGKEAQTFIHNLRNLDIPQGWDHQLHNTPAINAGLELAVPLYEKENSDWVLSGIAEVGTIQTRLGGGVEYRVGDLTDNWRPPTDPLRSDLRWHAFFNVRSYFQLYDGLLQGSPLFPDSSPHTMRADLIHRFRLHASYGLLIRWGPLEWELSQQLQTPSFRGAQAQGYGGAGVRWLW